MLSMISSEGENELYELLIFWKLFFAVLDLIPNLRTLVKESTKNNGK